MAIGTKTDFVIFDDEFFAGAYEVIMQQVGIFNAASRNTIRMMDERGRGDFRERSFFKAVSGGLIARRDPTAVGALTSAALAMDTAKEPKLSRRIGPVEDTIDAFKKIAEDPSLFSFIIGQQTGPEMMQDAVDSAVLAAETALEGVPALGFDGTASTITTPYLVDVLAKMGDHAGQVQCWVMHSKVWFDLVKEQIGLKIQQISNFNISEGAPITLGRPVIVTDSASLIVAGTTNHYVTLGLVPDAVTVRNSDDRTIITQPKAGLENLTQIIQGEYAITVGVKGFNWTGAANPNDAALGSAANWAQTASDVKSCCGVRLLTQ